MLRLLILIAVTLVGLYFLTLAYSAGDSAASNHSPDEVSETNTVAENAKKLIDSVVKEPESNRAEGTPPADLVEAEDQTPEKVQEFPGPELHPSPEYAGETPQPAKALPTADGEILYVTAQRVNFRAGPSTSDRVIGSLDSGDAVEAIGPTDADWINIRAANGRIGYLSGQFLSGQAPN